MIASGPGFPRQSPRLHNFEIDRGALTRSVNRFETAGRAGTVTYVVIWRVSASKCKFAIQRFEMNTIPLMVNHVKLECTTLK
jgi:hypothetical protein